MMFLTYDLPPLKRPNSTLLTALFKGQDVPTEVPMYVGLLLMHGSSFDQMSYLLSSMSRVGTSVS